MATAFAIPRDLSLKRYFFRSIFFHALLIAAAIGAAYLDHRGAGWGGVGGQLGGVKVNLVSPAGIPMPRPEAVTESKAVDPTDSLHKEDPKPKPPEPKTDAEKIPTFKKETRLPPAKKTRTLDYKDPVQDNDIPGQGGNPNLPTGYSQTPGPSGAGDKVIGQGGGDFGGRYPYYVDGVRSRIQQSWDQSTIEPAVRAAHRAKTVMTFRISANGSISNIKVAQSSGNSSMDYSAMRALQSIDTFKPLPIDYMGSYVDVTFDFDLSMMQ
jgi:protein TonB